MKSEIRNEVLKIAKSEPPNKELDKKFPLTLAILKRMTRTERDEFFDCYEFWVINLINLTIDITTRHFKKEHRHPPEGYDCLCYKEGYSYKEIQK